MNRPVILGLNATMRMAAFAALVASLSLNAASSSFAADASACLASKTGAKGKAACRSNASDGAKAASPAVPNNFRDVVAYALDINPQIAYVRGQYVEARAGALGFGKGRVLEQGHIQRNRCRALRADTCTNAPVHLNTGARFSDPNTSSDKSSANRLRARLTRLFMVPMAQPQIEAASS